jgi:hypothetical protein
MCWASNSYSPEHNNNGTTGIAVVGTVVGAWEAVAVLSLCLEKALGIIGFHSGIVAQESKPRK